MYQLRKDLMDTHILHIRYNSFDMGLNSFNAWKMQKIKEGKKNKFCIPTNKRQQKKHNLYVFQATARVNGDKFY